MKNKILIITFTVIVIIIGYQNYQINQLKKSINQYDMICDKTSQNIISVQGALSQNNDLVTVFEQMEDKINEYESMQENMHLSLYSIKSKVEYINFIYERTVLHQSILENLSEYEVIYGYISSIDDIDQEIIFDEVEFLGLEDEKRIRELGYDFDTDLPSGFLIHNSEEIYSSISMLKHPIYTVAYGENPYNMNHTDIEGFKSQVNEYYQLCKLLLVNGVVVELSVNITP